ncbi:hypothetical protein Dimus_017709, partial [Dionaea muscipula]
IDVKAYRSEENLFNCVAGALPVDLCRSPPPVRWPRVPLGAGRLHPHIACRPVRRVAGLLARRASAAATLCFPYATKLIEGEDESKRERD